MSVPDEKFIRDLFLPELKFVKQVYRHVNNYRVFLLEKQSPFELREPFKYLVFDDKKNPETGSGCFFKKWGGWLDEFRTSLSYDVLINEELDITL